MDKIWCVVVFLGVVGTWAAAEQGGIEAKAEAGRLTEFGSWWKPATGWEGRWWWNETGGSAWLKAGPVQMGPLVATSAGEGWRGWGPRTDLSGYWGVGVDTGAWGIWAVQDPEELEGGAQLRWEAAPWSVAAGADRTWTLQPPAPGRSSWWDRGRVGVVFDTGTTRLGVEGSGGVPAGGTTRVWGRASAATEAGPWRGEVRGSLGSDPSSDDPPWSTRALVGWQGWLAGWFGHADDPAGAGELGWKGCGTETTAGWGPHQGWFGSEKLETRVATLDLGAEASLAYDASWSGRVEASVSGRMERGRWSGSWSLGPGSLAPAQSVRLGWREPTFEALARWTVEGLRLGWIGPGISYGLTFRWFF